MNILQWISLGIVIILLYPFFIYFKSHVQMGAWMDSYFKSLKKHKDDKDKEEK